MLIETISNTTITIKTKNVYIVSTTAPQFLINLSSILVLCKNINKIKLEKMTRFPN